MTVPLRLVLTALLIYAAVWLESKWAMTLLFTLTALAHEFIVLIVKQHRKLIGETATATAQALKEFVK